MSQKSVFGYVGLVYGMVFIGILGFIVLFTLGGCKYPEIIPKAILLPYFGIGIMVSLKTAIEM